MNRILIALAIAALTACSPYSVRKVEGPDTEIPLKFENTMNSGREDKREQPWWSSFEDEVLENLVEISLSENLTLQAAWDRLRQAREQAVIAGSELYPQISTAGSAARTRLVNPELQGALSIDTNETFYFNNFAVRNGLSFEVDIWQRVMSGKRAEEFRAESVQASAENTALILTGTIANSWFNLNRQAELIKLIGEQTKSSETLLELTELRFALGKGSALDVYQQRQQLQSIKAEMPAVEAQFAASKNQLAVLLGQQTSSIKELNITGELPSLPSFPAEITPADLIDYRPDLAATRLRLQASEYDLAAAVADRYPRLNLGLSYDFQASQIEELFDRERGSMFGDLILPIVDGGRRRAVVRLTEAQIDEQIKLFDEQFLEAVADVETAISNEAYQAELVDLLAVQLKYAKATVRESYLRYSNGLIDYLQVTIALQALQSLERRVVNENANLLAARVQLHLALGGRWQPEDYAGAQT